MNSTSLITIDTVSKIQKELDSYDRRSLIFLLYDNPVIALQRITENDNALEQWAVDSSLHHNWQEKFLESLAICKLYGIIKKLGFNLSQVIVKYSPQVIDTSVYIDPVKKLFYFTSEQIQTRDLNIIKANLMFEIEVEDTNQLEIIILKVLCEEKNMGKLLTAIAKIPFMTTLVLQIKDRLLDKLPSDFTVIDEASKSTVEIYSSNKYYECTDSDRVINSDKLGHYPIKNLQRVGLAYIINQQNFTNNVTNNYELENRVGSDMDKKLLEKTLRKLNFEVLTADDLTAEKIMCNIAKIINLFSSTDSIFLLCILSHGIEGQIFGTDCIPVKVKNIQKVIDSEGREKLKNIPKVIFLQACQVNAKLVADAPLAVDYLIHWATSSEYEAYRSKKTGSIFIQVLCRLLSIYGQKEHLVDICTKVNNYVNETCLKQNLEQLPNINITLRKKLYLCPPL